MKWLILFLLPLSLIASEDKGVVSIRFPGGNEHEVKLFASATDTIPAHICHSDEALDSLLPSFYRYGGTVFITYRCTGETSKRYCIRNDEDAGVFYWIEKDSLTRFESWNEWFTSYGEVTLGQQSKFYAKQGDLFPIPQACNCGVFSVDTISGDWMKVSYDDTYSDLYVCDCAEEIVKHPLWVRWRKGDKILANVFVAE